MRLDIVSIFPDYFAPLELSLVGRAVFWGCITIGLAVGFVWGRDIPTMVGRIERPLFSGMIGAMVAALLPSC